MKKLLLILSIFTVFSSFAYADFAPAEGMHIYTEKSKNPQKNNVKNQCYFVVEGFSKKKNISLKEERISCNQDFQIIYYKKKNITEFNQDEIREYDLKLYVEDNKNLKNNMPVLMVTDLYIGNEDKLRYSKKLALKPGKSIYISNGFLDPALKDTYFKITYFYNNG